MMCNPNLTKLIDESIGTNWHDEPILMEQLLKHSDDKLFLDKLDEIKLQTKAIS